MTTVWLRSTCKSSGALKSETEEQKVVAASSPLFLACPEGGGVMGPGKRQTQSWQTNSTAAWRREPTSKKT